MIPKQTAKLTLTQKWSIWLSSLCLIHCLITPFIILLIPTFATFLTGWIEWALIASILPISSIAFFPIWIKHKSPVRLFEFLTGLALIIISQLFILSHQHELLTTPQILETVFMILGTLLVSYSTFKNRRHTHHCHNPHHEH